MARNTGFTYRERVESGVGESTVLEYLARRYRHSPRETWKERIETGEVRVNGARVDAGAALPAGAWLTWERPPWIEPEVPLEYALLHRDEHVLGVAKPAGLPTMPAGGFLEHTLLARVRERFPEASPVHRLGRWTSGVVLFARTPEARRGLAGSLRRGEMRKRYRALASGRAERRSWVVEAPIGPVPHEVLGTVFAASPGGRPARSEVTVLEQREDAFLADVVIPTGRPHQIRIHLAACGYPLVGDPLYVAGGGVHPGTRVLPGEGGYHLHAAEISGMLPETGERLRIECVPPPVLRISS